MPHPSEPFSPDEVVLLHEASGIVAVRKPAGLATQAPVGIDSMEARVRRWLERGRRGDYLGVPHRLDRPVSGVLLFATTPRAARQLSRQFERRQIEKRYRALLEPPQDPRRLPTIGAWDEWTDRIAKIPDEARARIVPSDEESGGACVDARDAVTRVRLLSEGSVVGQDGRSSVEVEFAPVTGRMHQLRLQAAARGMPVVGDGLYGSQRPFHEAAPGMATAPIALHASRIEYLDPETKQIVAVETPPPW